MGLIYRLPHKGWEIDQICYEPDTGNYKRKRVGLFNLTDIYVICAKKLDLKFWIINSRIKVELFKTKIKI